MTGFTLALGMLVDDAIGDREHHAPAPPRGQQAQAVRGTSEWHWRSLRRSTVVVFLPLMFMSDNGGEDPLQGARPAMPLDAPSAWW
jgi:multidrug efflux pump subunit AcrB